MGIAVESCFCWKEPESEDQHSNVRANTAPWCRQRGIGVVQQNTAPWCRERGIVVVQQNTLHQLGTNPLNEFGFHCVSFWPPMRVPSIIGLARS